MIVRVQSASGQKRVEVGSVSTSWGELLELISVKFDFPVGKFRISRRPLHNPEWVNVDPKLALGSIGIEHGTMVYLAPDDDVVVESGPVFKLTPKCQHNIKARCLHCLAPADPDAPLASWLCNHPPTAFCPKCLPPEEVVESSPANHEKEDPDKPFKVDIIPYAQFMAEKRALCKFKHHLSTVCHSCAPPEMISYAGKSRCDGGHRPWPLGICGKCAPSNAVLHLQSYRRCDGISFKDVAAGERFISTWSANPGIQRAAILFGRFIDEPTETGNIGAIRAEVEGIYIPPQEGLPDGVRLLRDPHEASNLKVAAELGLEPVGWAITTLPRSGKEYGGEVFLSGREVRQAARFQLKFSDNLNHSRFVTMVIQYNNQGNIEPKAYQISDQGVAMERDGLIEEGSAVGFLRPKTAKKGDFLSSIIFKNKTVTPDKDFLPDELLVKVIPMKPFNPQPMFKYLHFPFNGTDVHFTAHVQVHRNEPIHVQFSDFLLLLFLPQVMEESLALEIVRSVKAGAPPPANVQARIDYALKKYVQ
uniref:MPN domain-containing protein n=1 Tax=Spongospora subterranea TaxID=70186 RepID=A0A0H5QTA0_9EUKA|eukprot:CRZ05228.1 hypothetical protein [Spongospora subterranea]